MRFSTASVLAGFMLAMLVVPAQAQIPEHGLLREVWEDIGGAAVPDLTNSLNYPDRPSKTNYVTDFFESPTDVLENYGQRMHGYLVPPRTGNYTFWIATDDGGALFLSTDEDPANAREIAYVSSWTPSRQWSTEANQQSAPISLVAGRAYYVSALMKEQGGGDNLAVRWLMPDGTDQAPIVATNLLPYGISFGPPAIVQNPSNALAIEGSAAQFRVTLKTFGIYTYQWQRNGSPLPGATGPDLSYGPVRLADDHARFRCVVTNAGGSAVSDEAVLTVQPDVTRPGLVTVQNLGATQLEVTFTEPVSFATAGQASNYRLDREATVTAVSLGSSPQMVLLTTSLLTLGQTYTLTVSGVEDQAQSPNTILPDSPIPFATAEYAPVDIGAPPVAGSAQPQGGGADVRGSGEFGGTSDAFQFAWQKRTGDFDMRARLAEFEPTDPFAMAGLMVRETLAPGSRFVAAVATPATVGCFSLVRTNAGTTAARSGFLPANYPETWLRLRRAGNVFTAYASYDGLGWVPLNSSTLSLPTTVYFGLAASSRNTTSAALAAFRDIGTVLGGTPIAYAASGEILGPSSRQTSLVISEIMYHPKERGDGRTAEFIEIYNADLITQDLSGHRISGSVEYAFPEGTMLPAGNFAVIARHPSEFTVVTGTTGALGPFANTNGLPNDSGVVRLRNPQGAILLEVEYRSSPPWPVAADGAGHSLVLARPSFGESDPRAWAASAGLGGSPGGMEAVRASPLDSVVINEFLAHTDEPQLDYVELFNYSNTTVDVSGCWITDDPATNRFRIPDGTVIPARGLVAFDENQLQFRLRAAGDRLFLIHSNQTQVLDAVRYGAQENGVASGRYPDGTADIRPLSRPSPGSENETIRVSPIVINEIMYHPISENSDDEYVELHNRTAASVDLSRWRFTDGIDFRFPMGSILAASGYVVVARHPARLLGHHPGLSSNLVFGPFDGTLANGGERLALARPDTLVTTNAFGFSETNHVDIDVDEVTYGTAGRWGKWSDGLGSSLELVDPESDHLRSSNWADSDESGKAPWGTIEFTGRLDNGDGGSANRLQIMLQGPGECLVDDVEVVSSGGANLLANPNFASNLTGWTIQGNHRESFRESSGGSGGGACLHVRATGRGDTACNRIFAPLSAPPANNTIATLRARVRWLRGWPELMLRLRGSSLEAAGPMALPTNLGTPGARNSRAVANAGPAIFDVQHTPVLPAHNQPVLVTARLSDPDGIGAVLLRYRIDPASTLSGVALKDDGTGGDAVAGDGIYSASLPGRSAGTLVAFHVQAVDTPVSGATTTTFPADAPAHECLVRWGETQPVGNLGVYRLWQRQADYNRLRSRESLANDPIDATFVYNDGRVIYNMEMRGKGSPWHSGSIGADYLFAFPSDDPFLGARDVALVTVGNLGNDDTAQREQAAFWIGRQMGIPTLHRRHVLFFENGARKQQVYEDTEEPNGLFADRWWPEGPDGDLYKVEDWFEFNDAGTSFTFSRDATLQPFTTVDGGYKLARYRWSWRKRAVVDSANNYDHFFNLVTAVNLSGASLVTQVENLVDLENWMGLFALQHIVGNWDAYGYNRGKNAYIYKPVNGRFGMMPWDIDFVLGSGSDGATTDIFGCNDPTIIKLWNVAPFRRVYLRAFLNAIAGPLQNNQFDPVVDGRFAALTANGVSVTNPQAAKNWVTQRRNYLTSRIASMDTSTFAITSNNRNNFSSTQPEVTLTGSAPIAVAKLTVNGTPMPVTWTSVTAWSMQLALGARTNVLQIAGLDSKDRPLGGAVDSITVQFTGAALPSPAGQVVISEIMYHPLQQGASFVEIQNLSSTASFDLSGWRLDGVDYAFPSGFVLGPGTSAVVAADRDGFAAAYGLSVLPVGQYAGSLQNNGERLRLVQPGASPDRDLVIDEVRYDSELPWPMAANGQGPSLQLIDPRQDNWRVANWTCSGTNDPVPATPGRLNSVSSSLPAFPLVFLNEVLPDNTTGLTDRFGDRDPWIELFNSGATLVDLSGLYLSATLTNLTAWAFPGGTTIGPNQSLLIWADGEGGESTASELHTNFRLPSAHGVVALARLQFGAPVVLDYLQYKNQPADLAFGSHPDGQPQERRLFHLPTPGAANNPATPPLQVFINEWMASNTGAVLDPADGDAEDWIELYNGGAAPAHLSDYSLTDDLATPGKFVLPNGTVIPAGGYLLIWADEEGGQGTNGSLHANFKLGNAGETIGLFAPNGDRVDAVEFGPQTNNLSQGRFPDGMTEPFVGLELPTPGQANVFATANLPPVLSSIGNRSGDEGQTLRFGALGTDPDADQAVNYTLIGAPVGATIDAVTGAFSWATTEADGPGQYSFTVRVTDNGAPPRWDAETITITVGEANEAPTLDPLDDRIVEEGTTLIFSAVAQDLDRPAQHLRFSLDPGAPAGATVNELNGEFTWTPTEDQGPGTYPITLRVSDEAQPNGSAARTFTVTVREVDNPPVFQSVSLQVAEELKPFSLQLAALDPDTPPRALTYSLVTGPAGLQVNPGTGLVSWIPTEAQGPSSYLVEVQALEVNGSRASTLVFSIVVSEANQAPALSPLQDWTVAEGTSVMFACAASDADLPAQRLTFSLAPGAPAGATIDPLSGRFVWDIGGDVGPSTNVISVRVADDAIDSRTASATFTVVIQANPRIVINEIMYRPLTPGAEYVELHNVSTNTSWSLAGWRLTGTEFTFPPGATLAPGGFLVVARNLAVYQTAYSVTNALGNFTSQLGPDGGTVALWRPAAGGSDALVDYVTFQAQAPWPALANGGGASLQVIDPHQDNTRVANWTAVHGASTNLPRPVIAMEDSWRYWQDAADPAPGWMNRGYNDSAWPVGRALLVVEGAALPAAKNTQLVLGPMSYYFRARFQFDGNVEGASLQFSTILDDGAVFYLNGQPVSWLGMTDRVIPTRNAASTRTVSDAILEGPFVVSATHLVVGENVLAVEVHQTSSASSDIVFGMSADVLEIRRESSTPGSANSVRATLEPFPSIYLNEVLASNLTGLRDSAGDRDPWIELVNRDAATVSLDGYSLAGAYGNLRAWTFPAGASLAPGAHRLVWADAEPGESSALEWHTDFRLSAPSGVVVLSRLQNGQPAVVDSLAYDGLAADQSFGFSDPDRFGESPAILPQPSPGAQNFTVTEPMAPEFLSIAFGSSGDTFLEWSAISARTYRVEFKDALEEPAWQSIGQITATGITASWVDNATGSIVRRFYRVVLLP